MGDGGGGWGGGKMGVGRCLTESRSHGASVFFFYFWRQPCSAEQDGLSSFGRGSSKEYSREIIEKSVQQCQRSLLM